MMANQHNQAFAQLHTKGKFLKSFGFPLPEYLQLPFINRIQLRVRVLGLPTRAWIRRGKWLGTNHVLSQTPGMGESLIFKKSFPYVCNCEYFLRPGFTLCATTLAQLVYDVARDRIPLGLRS